MNEIKMDQLLIQMRAMADQANGNNTTAVANNHSPDFTSMFNDAINKVNETQKTSGELQKQFELGNPNVDLTDVMIASQKSSISFQAMTQVRNKLISAYQEIMNMQV
ncbi:MAG: flagellar hook-basal body complex protein FliE [Pseudomonadota bacterium]